MVSIDTTRHDATQRHAPPSWTKPGRLTTTATARATTTGTSSEGIVSGVAAVRPPVAPSRVPGAARGERTTRSGSLRHSHTFCLTRRGRWGSLSRAGLSPCRSCFSGFVGFRSGGSSLECPSLRPRTERKGTKVYPIVGFLLLRTSRTVHGAA